MGEMIDKMNKAFEGSTEAVREENAKFGLPVILSDEDANVVKLYIDDTIEYPYGKKSFEENTKELNDFLEKNQ